jgi:hypothetical protein
VRLVGSAGTEGRGFVLARIAAASVCRPHPLHLRVHPLLRHPVSLRLLGSGRSADETHRGILSVPAASSRGRSRASA